MPAYCMEFLGHNIRKMNPKRVSFSSEKKFRVLAARINRAQYYTETSFTD